MCMYEQACVLSVVLAFAGSYGTLCAGGLAYALGGRMRIVLGVFVLGLPLTILSTIAIGIAVE